MNISMTKTTHPGKLPPADRLGFGSVFTDHMFLMNYTDREGWHNARIVPFGPISISPAASVLHYGTEVFEGLKAYRRPDGAVQLFRPWENVARLNRSCDRLGLPRIDERDGLQAIRELVALAEKRQQKRQEAIDRLLTGYSAYLAKQGGAERRTP